MFAEALPPLEGYGMSLNYGLNRVRFTSPVPSGSRIRGRFRVEDVEDVAGGKQARVAGTIELEDRKAGLRRRGAVPLPQSSVSRSPSSSTR